MDVPVELLSSLCDAYGPSGYEDEVRKLIVDEISKFVGQFEIDTLGNVYTQIAGAQEHPRLMLSAHMDEVGFLINYVEDSGFLRFGPMGTIDARILPAQRVILRGNEKCFGVIGSKPPHVLTQDEMKKAVELGGLYIDIGASSHDEVKQLGIDVGTTGTFDVPFRKLGNGTRVIGKALDNRAGCAVALKLLESFAKNRPRPTVVFAFTAQEELGSRGAIVAANRINPDAALVFENAVAADSPDVGPRDRLLQVGHGPAVRIMDASMITQRHMLEYMVNVAQAEHIAYQPQVNMGGKTDAGPIHLSGRGVPTGVISTPCRYLHSPSLLIDLEDLNKVLKLSESLVRGLTNMDKINYQQ